MEIYKELVLTSLQPQEVAGNEGLISAIGGIVKAVIKRIVDGLKWLWNLITGNGSSNSGKSVSEMSANMDKALQEAPRTLAKVDTEKSKLTQKKLKYFSNTPDSTFKSVENFEKVFTPKKPTKGGDTVSGELSSRLDEVKDKIKENTKKLEPSATPEERHEAVKEIFTPAAIKETNKEFEEAMKSAGVTTASQKEIKEGTNTILASAALGTTPPKEDLFKKVVKVPLKGTNVWWARSKDVIEAASHKSQGDAVGLDLVNAAVVSSINNCKKIYAGELATLEKIKLIPPAELVKLKPEEIKAMAEEFAKDYTNRRYEFWHGVEQVSKVLVKENSYGYPDVKVQWHGEATVKDWSGTISISINTFSTFNKELKGLAVLSEKLVPLLRKFVKYVKEVDAYLGNDEPTNDEQRAMVSFYLLMEHKVATVSQIISLIDTRLRQAEDISHYPMAFLMSH